MGGMVQLARVEAGSVNATGRFSNIEEIITIALERAESLLISHHLEVNLQKELPLIRVDARAIAEVVYNLVENAAKYSRPETTITITAKSHGNRVLISVMDEGKGIPEDMREKVFEKFVRLDGEQSQGLGLGLAIARGIVEAQNGNIEIHPGKNGGAWLVVFMIPILVLMFLAIHKHYVSVASQLSMETIHDTLPPIHHTVIVPISGIHRGVIKALQYAKSISADNVRAVYVDFDDVATTKLKEVGIA